MFRRQLVAACAVAFALTPVLATGCSSDQSANARVTLDSTISPGTHSASDCPETGEWLTIGSFGNPAAGEPVKPVDNGGSDQQGTASVTCSVTPSGAGFHVAATASLSGATGGAFRIEGDMNPTGDQPNLDVSISAQGRVYTQHDCVAKYTTALETVAAGRVWADLSCPNVTNDGLQRTCAITAQFRFENCGQ